MRYAILSDVHANAAALRAVLADAADLQAERIVCLGDVLGYGPEPVEALELIYRRAHVCLAGNHDDAVSGRCLVDDFTDVAAAAVRRHRAALARNAVDWLRRLPHVCEFPAADGSATEGAFACAHGEFEDPKRFGYVLEAQDALPSWYARTEQLLFVGHTHRPGIFVLGGSGVPHALEPMNFVLEPGKRYLVNVGSVGYPRSGACRSFYCLYDDTSRVVSFRSLPFDLDGYRAKMNGAGVDDVPWIEARAQARKPTEIRGAETLGRPPPERRPAAVPPQATPPPRLRPGPALVVAALLLALGGVWCTWRLVDSVREGRRAAAVARAIAVPPVPSADAVSAEALAASLPLFGGWVASFEFPDVQKVTVDTNRRHVETAFRLTSGTNGVIRLAKSFSLVSRPAKVCYSVRLLTTARPGTTMPFRFTARVLFRDGTGKTMGDPSLHQGRLSAQNRVVAVPPGADVAELQVDCRLQGTFDLAVPTFKAVLSAKWPIRP